MLGSMYLFRQFLLFSGMSRPCALGMRPRGTKLVACSCTPHQRLLTLKGNHPYSHKNSKKILKYSCDLNPGLSHHRNLQYFPTIRNIVAIVFTGILKIDA